MSVIYRSCLPRISVTLIMVFCLDQSLQHIGIPSHTERRLSSMLETDVLEEVP